MCGDRTLLVNRNDLPGAVKAARATVRGRVACINENYIHTVHEGKHLLLHTEQNIQEEIGTVPNLTLC